MNDCIENLDKITEIVYDDSNEVIYGGAIMTVKEMLSAAYRATGTNQAVAAATIGWTAQQISQRMVRNSLRADDFLAILDNLGIELTMTVKNGGKEIKTLRAGAGRRVHKMVDNVMYDTAQSDALSNNFYADGENEYTDGKATELYKDKNNRYFFAEYVSWEGGKDSITPVTAEIAAKFIEKYGTELNKKPDH